MTKTCSVCKIDQPLDAFYKSSRARDGRQHRCIGCSKELTQKATKAWRQANPVAASQSNIRTKIKLKYGLTLEEITELLDLQSGCCAICDEPIGFDAAEKRDKPHVDHNHDTGIVRGVLCLTCYTGLGMFGDSLDLLLKAVDYMRRARQPDRLSELAPEMGDAIVGSHEN